MSDEYFGNFYLGPQTRNGNSRQNPVQTFNNLSEKERLLNSVKTKDFFLIWSTLVRRHLSDQLLWSIFQSSVTYITHYISCWTFCAGSYTCTSLWTLPLLGFPFYSELIVLSLAGI